MPSRYSLLITAGPTHEPIDDVRYIANRSSGRLGLALAAAAAARRLPTTLLLGPGVPTPPNSSNPSVTDVTEATSIACARFRTTEDLRAALARDWPSHDVLIMAAAVADFRPAATAAGSGASGVKLSRGEGGITLDLEPTPDLLAELAEVTREDQTVIGFALAPAERLEESARRKLVAKRLDAIVANPLATMGDDFITATLYLAGGEERKPRAHLPKRAFADWLLDEIDRMRG